MAQPLRASAKPTLLLVEDDPAVRRSLQLILQGSGFSVRSYGTVTASLADPDLANVDGMVADYRLPDGDGLSLLTALRAAGFRGQAILITAHGHSQLEAKATEAGYARFLEKPLADRMLRETVTRLLA